MLICSTSIIVTWDLSEVGFCDIGPQSLSNMRQHNFACFLLYECRGKVILGGEIDQHQRTTAIRTTSNHS